MKFNDTTTNNGLCQHSDFLVGSDVNSYPLTDKARSANSWYERLVASIQQVDSTWEYNDNNNTQLPEDTTDLVSNQEDYALDSAKHLLISRVETKNEDGTWTALSQVDFQNIDGAISEYKQTAGTPQEYDLRGDSIFLYPRPSHNSSDGLKIFYRGDIVRFSGNDTTTDNNLEPGFNPQFHKYLSYGMAYDYAVAKNLKKASGLRSELANMERDVEDFYEERAEQDKRVVITPNIEMYH